MFRSLAVLLVGVPSIALGQDQEYREPEVEPGAETTEWSLGFESEYHAYDNLDFRELDESSDQAILDSDDKNQFAFTGLSFGVVHPIADDVSVTAAASHRGLWGTDQVGGINRFGGFVYVTALSMDWTPLGAGDDETAPPLMVRVGRQYFDLGGVDRENEYAFADVIDGVRVDVGLGSAGRVVVVPLSVVSSAGDAADANFFDYISQSTSQTFGFRGDHMTRRYGGELVLDGMVDGLDVRAYGFYTDIAAVGSGADISYDGLLGNFSDNDWVGNYGLRAGFETGPLQVWGVLDGSTGIDRKELVAQDADTNGIAFGGGVEITPPEEATFRPGLNLDFYQSQGAVYTSDGLLWSHGYVSLKGRQVGGLLTDRFLGWHPSAYVGSFGLSHDLHEPDRKGGTMIAHAGAFAELPAPIRIDLDWYFLKDTGATAVNMGSLDELVPPYGYSRAEFAAQKRLGLVLGQEIDGKVTYSANDKLSFHLNGGVFLPGAYYAIEVDRVAGDQLGGQASAWALNGGTRVRF